MLTDNNVNKLSAHFGLTIADLQQSHQSHETNELQFDMSSLHQPFSSEKKDEFSDVKLGLQEFNKSIQQYTKKFNEQDKLELSHNLEQFKTKINQYNSELQTEPLSSAYKTSLYSIKQQTDIKAPYYSTNNKQQQSTSFANMTLLNSSTNKSAQNIRADPYGNLTEQLEYHRIKYYDQFLPDSQKLLNNPLKYLKYKIDSQNKYNLNHCLDSLINN